MAVITVSLLNIILNFSPKIRFGILINVMVIKPMYLFLHNIDALSHFITSKCKYAACIVVKRRRQGLAPEKFRLSTGTCCALSGSLLYLYMLVTK